MPQESDEASCIMRAHKW